jgi:hypothetical protein
LIERDGIPTSQARMKLICSEGIMTCEVWGSRGGLLSSRMWLHVVW